MLDAEQIIVLGTVYATLTLLSLYLGASIAGAVFHPKSRKWLSRRERLLLALAATIGVVLWAIKIPITGVPTAIAFVATSYFLLKRKSDK